jgi:hypothetical protein
MEVGGGIGGARRRWRRERRRSQRMEVVGESGGARRRWRRERRLGSASAVGGGRHGLLGGRLGLGLGVGGRRPGVRGPGHGRRRPTATDMFFNNITSLTFFIRFTIYLFYKYFCKLINQQFKSKVPFHRRYNDVHFTLIN